MNKTWIPRFAARPPSPHDRIMSAALPQGGVMLLLRLRLMLLRNHLRQTLSQQPFKLVGVGVSVMLIWAGLYYLLVYTFRFVGQSVLESIVATPLIFTFFFLALMVMLAFSSAILSYGGLFRQNESAYLLASPLPPVNLVIVRYLESLTLASWSLLLLGLPLMMALKRTHPQESWTFYPLFLGLFLLFIPIPGAVGLFLAWLVSMVCPKTPRRVLLLAMTLVLTVGGWWLWKLVNAPVSPSEWLTNIYDRIALVQGAMLPHTWVSKGINHAVQGQASAAMFYLFVTLANALFASMVAIAIVARWYTRAYTRAQVSGARSVHRSGRTLAWIAEVCFAYLPRQQRLLAGKDLTSFFRDPLQWSQMAILLGLLALYASNVQRMWTDLANPNLGILVAFLNLTAVSLILATFTSRFVFPLLSLEGQQLWMLGLLPLPRRRMVVAKFLYALTITLVAAFAVLGISIYRLRIPGTLAAAHLTSIVAICIGLCGVSTGMGARMPIFNERNPARIAGGFGGTVSLLLSVALVVGSLAVVGIMSFEAARSGFIDKPTLPMFLWVIAVVAINFAAAAVAMKIGIRHFERAEM